MRIKQISLFLENTSGRLVDALSLLSEADINLRALSLSDTSDFGILRLIVNDVDKAHQILTEKHYTVLKSDVVAVEVEDRPGALVDILRILKNAGINVEYTYAFVERSAHRAILIFRFDDMDKAIESLKAEGVTLLSSEEVLAR
jgi:hypothetical protein